jgi:gliding motility-associated-like protein
MLALLIGMCALQLNAQISTDVVWQRCLGGSDMEWGSRLQPISDGGFICVGYGTSSDGDFMGTHGGTDILATKLNADGTVQWSRLLGGSSEELGFDCLEASDGSIMIVGDTYSTDGDVTSNNGGQDLWVLKLSPLGAIIWQQTYGGSNTELGGQMQETADGGFILQVVTTSEDGDVVGFHPGSGTQDEWLLKINSSGNVEWSRALGGSGLDSGGRLILTADGGFLASFSSTESNDGDVTNYHGTGDCWLVKLSATGTIEWSRTVGGSQREFGTDVLEQSNGDIMLLGTTASSDGDIAHNQGGYDVLLARLSSSGTLLWERTYGGSLYDDCRSLVQTLDGGFILTGSSSSSDGDLSTNQGEQDVWLLKVDANGSPEWQRSFGGALSEFGFLTEEADGGFLLSGYTYSNNGDVQASNGGRELWFVKFSSVGDLLWQRCLGGSNEDWGYLQTRTSDGGYVAFGYTYSNDGDVSGNHGQRDMWVVKLKVIGPPPPICTAANIFVPTAFSPNATGNNDQHCVFGVDCIKTMHFNIFNRWGNTVFESTDPKACWDGTYNGQALDPAVFVYHLSATMTNGEIVERQGNITLVR